MISVTKSSVTYLEAFSFFKPLLFLGIDIYSPLLLLQIVEMKNTIQCIKVKPFGGGEGATMKIQGDLVKMMVS